MRFIWAFIPIFLITSLSFSQETYNSCGDALNLCPATDFVVNNHNATEEAFPNGADDFNFCFTPKKTIWMTFQTNETGGPIAISLNNLSFSVGTKMSLNLIKAGFPCDGTTYQNDTCVTNISTSQTIQTDTLLPETTYYICLSGMDEAGTISEFEVDLSISGDGVDRTQPSLSFYTEKDTICKNEEVVLVAYLNNCPDSSQYRWYRNGELFAVSDSSYIRTTKIENGDVITVQNHCFTACVDTVKATSDTFFVKNPDFQISGDTTINAGEIAILNVYSPVDSLLWTPSYLVQFADSTTTTAFPKETTTFYVNAYKDGCQLSKSLTVTVKDDLKIFNTFSPNDDGINEKWRIKGIERYPDASVAIFTRWGQRVYFQIGYNDSNAFDGTMNGKKLEAGVYYYVIDLDDNGKTKPIKGALNLIR